MMAAEGKLRKWRLKKKRKWRKMKKMDVTLRNRGSNSGKMNKMAVKLEKPGKIGQIARI